MEEYRFMDIERISSVSLTELKRPRTWSPECDTLLLVGLADAVVAVTIHSLTRVPIMKVHIGWAVRGSPCTEFWEVTGIAGGSACSSWRLQLK